MGSGKRPPRRARVPPSMPDLLVDATLPRDDLTDDGLRRALGYDGLDLSARTARLVDIVGCRLVSTSLAGSTVERLSVLDSVFERCDLANLSLSSSSLTRVELTGCRATGLVASGALLRNVTVRGCTADLSAYRFATFTNVEVVDCRLQGADFIGADLRGATFRRCDLTRAELSQVKARGAVFVDCVWDGVRGVPSLAGATVAHGSPLDASAFMLATACSLGIVIADPDDFPDPP